MAYVLAPWREQAVLLAAQESDKVVVQPAAAVVTGVNYKGIGIAVLAKSLGVKFPEAG